uniref:Uncharacterized protein n=1 Tax=Candidatus Kentrum sp. UNK TaxID=2126344 RepID=A0A450ZWM9_9GAMM|nr:MAG: Phage related hypothetical protein (DUF1799) [Candidatus Kentron sp. UNK]VFK68297.1 MAG: Phage related hypothetical protein (DUF1799) [Candidatus Kentron sp. UNK]
MAREAAGPEGKDEIADDLAAFGADDAFIARYRAREIERHIEIFPENWQAILAWQIIQSQMTRAGLRYGDVRAGLEMAEFSITPELFEKLRIIETAIVRTWNEIDRERRG